MSTESTTAPLKPGADVPHGRPDLDGKAGVFVPSAEFDLKNSTTLKRGAAIVGFANDDGSLTIYYEANRFDDSSLHKWEHKALKAYERMIARAPTVSKTRLAAAQVEHIGIIDGDGISLKHPDSLRRWLAWSDAADTAPAQDIVLWRVR